MTEKTDISLLTVYPRKRAGGCYGQMLRAVNAVIESGGALHYISSEPFPLPKNSRLVFHKFPFHAGNELVFNALFYIFSPFHIMYVAIVNRVNGILLFNEEFAALCAPAKLITGAKITLIIEGYMKAFLESRKFNTAVKIILKLYGKLGIFVADSIFAVSRDLSERIKKYYGTGKKIGVFYNYVPKKDLEKAQYADLKGALGIPGDPFIISCVAQLIPRKNIGYLLKEFSSLSFKTTAYIILSGSGPEKQELETIASETGISGRVKFLGERKDVLNIMKASDIVVLPTIHDDCPLALIEALGLGVPCIASNTGGIPEILKYGELMFDPRETGALAEKLGRAITDPLYLAEIRRLCSERKPFFDKDWDEEIIRLVKEK